MRKRVKLVKEHPRFEDGLLDKDYEKLLKLLQLGDQNLDNVFVDQARSLHNVDPRCKISRKSRYRQEDEMLDERNVEETLRKSKVTEKATMLEKVKSEPLEFDCGGMNVNERANKRTRVGERNTAVPVKTVVVSMDGVKEEAPDSDSGGNHEISERCRKRPRVNVRNNPQMLKSSPVKKNMKIERTSKKKEKMQRSMPAKSSSVLSKSRKGMKNEVHARGAHSVSSNSNRIFNKRKGSEVLHSSRYRRDPRVLSATIDMTYEAFLNHVVVSGNQLIYTPPWNGTSKIMGGKLQIPSDSEQTILDSDRRDGNCPSYVRTEATVSKTVRNNLMKRKMEYPKNYRDSSSDANLNQQNSRQPDKSRVSDVKTKAAANRTLGRSVMTENMSCPKKYRDTLLGSDQNEHDSHKHDKSHTLHASESFQEFKSCIQPDGKSMIYKRSNGGRKIYEKVKTASKAETNAMHRDHHNSTPSLGTETTNIMESRNKFRKGLMQDLKRPYNQEEHLKLLENACKRGPSDQEMDVFDEMDTCQTPKKYGRTYLEVYKDLAEKISELEGGRSRKLNLLRGLMYWLENKSEEGSFMPWRDNKCLKALSSLSEIHPAATTGSTCAKSERT